MPRTAAVSAAMTKIFQKKRHRPESRDYAAFLCYRKFLRFRKTASRSFLCFCVSCCLQKMHLTLPLRQSVYFKKQVLRKRRSLRKGRRGWPVLSIGESSKICRVSQVQSVWKVRHLKYGYLWWVIDEEEHSFAALGHGGNAVYVNPKARIVAAVFSLFAPRVKDRIDFIKSEIEPFFA